MIQSMRSGARLALVLLCVFASQVMTAQQAQLSPRMRASQEVPATRKMPNVLWLEQKDALLLLRQQLQRSADVNGEAGIVVAQDPPPGADVISDRGIVIVLGVPALSLAASNPSPQTDEQVTFSITLDPPPARPASIEYHFVWDDGSDVPTREPQTTRGFSEARIHTVAAYAVINERWTTGRTEMRLSVAAPPPPTETMPPQSPWPEGARLSLSASTVDPQVNDEVMFKATFDPPPPAAIKATYRFQWNDGTADTLVDQPAASHRFSAAGTYVVSAVAVIDDRWTVDGAQLHVTVFAAPPPPLPPSVPWLAILLVAAALIVAALLFRVLRPKAVTQSPGPPPAVSIRSGLGSTSHTIEHPEQIRNGVSVRLRGGMRSVVTAEGGADA